MGRRIGDNAVPLAAAAVAVWFLARLGLYAWAQTDYDNEARPALDALIGGHLARFAQLAPVYGGSLIIRAPFALIKKLWHGGQLSVFRAAAAPCLIASATLGVWLVDQMRRAGRSAAARALVLVLCVANPITLSALQIGHPEELLGGVLCVAAVIAAARDRPLLAGALLGLAVANKEWALVAVAPVVLALPRHRLRGLLTAGGVTAIVLSPLLLSNHFAAEVHGAATQPVTVFNPSQVWWFFGHDVHVLHDAAGHVVPGHATDHATGPSWVTSISHPLILAVTIPLTLLCVWLRRRGNARPAEEPLLLLVLFLLLRCMLDPWDFTYYALPFLLAMVAWEALGSDGLPVRSLIATGSAWFVFQWTLTRVTPDQQSVLFLAFAVPTLLAILQALYAPGLARRIGAGIHLRDSLPPPRLPEAGRLT